MAERLTIREAEAAAKELGEFTRIQFAEVLGIRPIAAGKWLERMVEERDTLVSEGRTYRWSPADEREAPPAPSHEGIDVRVVARRLGRFTPVQLAEATGLGESYVHRKIKDLIEQEVIRDSGQTEYRDNGKRPVIYEVIPIEAPTAKRTRHPNPADGVRETQSHRGGQAPPPKIKHKFEQYQEIIDAAYDAGADVWFSGGDHIKIKLRSGVSFTMAKTPRSSSAKKTRAQARRLGLNV